MAYLKLGDPIPTKGKGAKLTDRQRLFVDEYMVDLNATQAVIRSGYKNANPNRLATELLHHPLIKAAIDVEIEKKKERLVLSADYVINKLVDIAEHTEKGNPQAALRALELLGKNLGLFKERTEISGPDGEAIQYARKIEQDVADFTGAIARLAKRSGAEGVDEFTNTGTSG